MVSTASCWRVDGAGRSSSSKSVNMLATADLPASVQFWEAAGFDVEHYGDDFAIAEGFGVELHLDARTDAARPAGGCYLHLRAVDDLRAAWVAAGLSPSEAVDQPWDMREFHLTDPGGNHIRVGDNL